MVEKAASTQFYKLANNLFAGRWSMVWWTRCDSHLHVFYELSSCKVSLRVTQIHLHGSDLKIGWIQIQSHGNKSSLLGICLWRRGSFLHAIKGLPPHAIVHSLAKIAISTKRFSCCCSHSASNFSCLFIAIAIMYWVAYATWGIFGPELLGWHPVS